MQLFAADRYWIAGSSGYWNNMNNWSSTAGGTGGASVPGSSDFAYFTNNGNGNCNLDIAPTVAGISISGYTGTINMAGNNLTSAGSSNCSFSSGTLTNSAGLSAIFSINCTGTVRFSGTAFGTSLTQAPTIQCVAFSLFLSGSVFYGVSSFEKNGSNLDYAGTGGNTFNAATTIINSGTAVLSIGYSTRDIFNADVTFTNSGTAYIGAADNTANNQFNGNIVVNNPNGGQGVSFDSYTGTSSTLASGKTITVGTSFTGGTLGLMRFTQSGSTAQTMTLTGTATLNLGPSTTFNGNVNFKTPNVVLQSAVYNGATTYIEKTGSSGNYSNTGGNTFNGVATLVNSGSGQLITGYSNPDVFNADARFTNSGTSSISIGDHASGNLFNGNILVNSTSGVGIYFNQNTGASATMASGKTVSVETSFTAGTLALERFTQLGSTAQNITLTGAGILAIGPSSVFNAAVTGSAPRISMQQSTFNGVVSMTNTSNAANATSYGGNTFNAVSGFTNTGTTTWTLANSSGDVYNAAASFTQSSTGAIRPASTGTNNFYGNITVNSSTAVQFGNGGGIVQLVGSSAQTIGSANSVPVFQNLVVNNAAGVVLGNAVSVGSSGTLTNGIVSGSSVNYLNFAAGSTVSGVSNSSYVDGTVMKTGNTDFVFPVGNGGFYAPISILFSSGGTTSDKYTAQYFKNDPNSAGYNTSLHDATIDHLSTAEYWSLLRPSGASTVNVKLSWDAGRSGTINGIAQLTIGRWNNSKWVDHGNGGTTGNSSSGTIVTAAATSLFGPFTLASTTTMNILPVGLSSFTAVWGRHGSQTAALLQWVTSYESGNAYFDVERMAADGTGSWTAIGRVNSLGDAVSGHAYTFWDDQPLTGSKALYRLKQVDLDGNKTYSKTVLLDATGTSSAAAGISISLRPNPARSDAYLTANGMSGRSVRILLFDAGGRKVREQDEVLQGDPAVVTLSVNGLAAGSYFVRVSDGQGAPLAARFVVVR